jgi:ferredoxin--NADP+ reductase
MDVTRILLRDRDELAATDITDEAVARLRESSITDVYVLGRRGAAQAAFSPAEIKEIAELDDVDLVVRPEDAALDEHSAAWLEEHGDKNARKNVAFLQEIAGAPVTKPKRVHLRLLTSPVRYDGDGRVEQVTIGRNEIYLDDSGRARPRDTGDREQLAAGLVLRAVGYRGVPLPGAPFDDRRGLIPNKLGRVVDAAGAVVPRLYVAGWAKRGPTGLIGTNRADAKETVDQMFDDLPGLEPIERVPLSHLEERAVDWAGWQRLDELEVERGRAKGKIRDKFTRVDDMISALTE